MAPLITQLIFTHQRGALDKWLLLSSIVEQQPQWSHWSHRYSAQPAGIGLIARRASRTATLLTVMVALLGLVMPISGARLGLAASTYLCTGYGGCEASGYGHAGYRQAGSTMYWRMYAGHNCTNYVAYRLIQSGMPDRRPWEGSGNAANWGVEMASITDQTPRVGSVAWYRANVAPAGSAGHVAYVEQVVSETEIIVSEDYWGGDFHWRRITKTGAGWPSGFIHFNDFAVEPTTPPTVSGTAAVGAPLEVQMGVWSPSPTTVTVRWLADGVAIPGATATTYVPTPELKGKTLTAEVTAERDGYTAGRAALTTASVAPGTLQAIALPTIQGSPEVGQTLTVSDTSWSPQPSRTTTQWYADGLPIAEADSTTLVLSREHIGKRISARVAGSAKGYRKLTASAPETTPVLAKAIKITRSFVVKGRPQLGRALVARAGDVQPSNASAAYTWLRDGKPIFKATNRTYTVRPKDIGRSLSLRVSLSRTHFRDSEETIAVSGLATSVPTVRVRTSVARGRVAVNVRVKAPGVPAPAGPIALRVDGRTTEGQLVNGLGRLVVRGLRPGTKPVVVRYAGTELVRPAAWRSKVMIPQRRT
jgi:surface antigen